MRVLVTGCSVFLGAAVVRALHQRNHSAIATAFTERSGVGSLDVRDPLAVRALVDQVDAVVHLAAIRAYGEGPAVEHASAVIVEGTSNVVAASKRAGVPVVIAGSGEEYGPTVSVPYREDGAYAPVSHYGRAKRRAVLSALEAYRDGVVVLRPSTVYGPRQPSIMLVAQCLRAAIEDSAVRINGGEQRRDHVFVEDVAEAFVRAAEAVEGVCGHEFNVASGDPRSVRSVAERVMRCAGRGRVEVGPASTRAGDVMDASFSTELTASKLGWRARTSLEDGVSRTVEEALAVNFQR